MHFLLGSAAVAAAIVLYIILADYPTGNLDMEKAETVLAYLPEFAKSGGAVLVASHGEKAGAYADTAVNL